MFLISLACPEKKSETNNSPEYFRGTKTSSTNSHAVFISKYTQPESMAAGVQFVINKYTKETAT